MNAPLHDFMAATTKSFQLDTVTVQVLQLGPPRQIGPIGLLENNNTFEES